MRREAQWRERMEQDFNELAHVGTAIAAKALARQPQTLRRWAALGCGPIKPSRVGGRLAWALVDIRRILEGGRK